MTLFRTVRMRKRGWSFPIFDPPRRRLVSYRSAQKHLAPRAGACHHRHRIMTRLPPLSSIEAFLEVARHGTVKAAASELGLSMPALSRRIQTLEQDRKSVVSGKSVSVRVDLGGRRIIKQKNKITKK